jgi:hypothetical protein
MADSYWSLFSAGAGESKEAQADRQRRDRFGAGKCSYIMSIIFIRISHIIFLEISGVDEGRGLRKGDKKLLKKIH